MANCACNLKPIMKLKILKRTPRLLHYQNANFLLELSINLAMSIIMLSALIHYIFMITKAYTSFQHKIDYQNAQLIANHYLGADIRNSNCLGVFKQQNIKAKADILILNSNRQQIAYYIRPSIIPAENHLHSYALYRDDFDSVATALIDGIIDFQVSIKQAAMQRCAVHLKLEFKNLQTMEVVFVPRNHK